MIRISLPVFFLVLSGCVGAVSRPCYDGGEPAREIAFRGNKQCYQHRTKDGKYVNHGLYREWWPNGRIALEGQYNEGVKSGKWIEYDQNGKKVSEKVYDEK